MEANRGQIKITIYTFGTYNVRRLLNLSQNCEHVDSGSKVRVVHGRGRSATATPAPFRCSFLSLPAVTGVAFKGLLLDFRDDSPGTTGCLLYTSDAADE